MKKPSGSLFGSFVVSYMAVLALPLCVLVFFYYPSTTRAVIERETSWNARAVEQLRLSWESFLRYARTLPGAVERNQSIQFSGAEEPGYRRYVVANEMRKYSAADDYVFDMFLYLKSDGFLFSKNGVAYSLDDFGRPGDGYYFPGWKHEELERDLAGERGSLVRGAQEIIAPTNNRVRVIGIVRPLNQSWKGNYASILILVREDALLGVMRAASKERGGDFFVIDPEGRVVASLDSASHLGAPMAIVRRVPVGEGCVLDIGGKQYIAARSQSEIERWNYLSLFPVSGRLAELRSLQVRTLLLVIAILLVETLIISVSLRRNFYPLKRLAASLGSAPTAVSIRPAKGRNEIAVIHEALDGLASEKSTLDEQLRDALPKLRDAASRGILNRSYAAREDLDAALVEYGMRLAHPLLAIAVFRCRGRDEELGQGLRALEGRFPAGLDGAFLCAGFESVFICSHDEGKHLRDFLEEALPTALPAGAVTAIGIGRSSVSAKELKASYAQALQAADRSAQKGGAVVEFDEAKSESSLSLYSYYEWIRAFELALREDDVGLIEEMTERIISLVGADGIEPHLARGLYLNAIAVVLDGLYRFRGDEEDFASLASLVFYDTYAIEEMSEILRASSRRLCTLVSEDRGTGDDSPGKDAIATYIESADIGKDLCLKTAAEHFGMKASTFSYRFKRVMGENFKEYAERLRIEASKTLLLETDESVESIADKVGFSSAGSSSFIRAFKKSVGMTPKRYRESTQTQLRS